MLDDVNVLKQRDPEDALGVAARLYEQVSYNCELVDAEHDGREIKDVVVAGMGGSALAADVVKAFLGDRLKVPFDVVKSYTLPKYVQHNTLVIASSHSGNTEETISCFTEAIEHRHNPQLAVISTGGTLQEMAAAHRIMYGKIPHDTQPRMGMIYNLRVLLKILIAYGLVTHDVYDELDSAADWLHHESDGWTKEMPTTHNYAKQLALTAVGKTPVFYAGNLMAPVAYKWKISWNENAKNVAFWNYYPEFNHNEFLGWTSHPVEKPFVVFDLVSEFEHPQILKRFALSDKLLSGRRPKANEVSLAGDTVMKQILWGCVLADFVSIYVGILNGVDPTQVDLIEKFKKELS
ncbi:bifunctional phosphoglucose/phosphomannose isomerase [Candidatus Saccharibacteria bacterium]|nr:MAG: bifunctional phosphoglucose/phosphomannose isomerase [Candidatus Saccharibacteria bacterium]